MAGSLRERVGIAREAIRNTWSFLSKGYDQNDIVREQRIAFGKSTPEDRQRYLDRTHSSITLLTIDPPGNALPNLTAYIKQTTELRELTDKQIDQRLKEEALANLRRWGKLPQPTNDFSQGK